MKKTLLIANDFKVTRNVMFTSLEKINVSTLKTLDGEDVKKYINCKRIDLLITDLNMSRADGIELIKYVKKDIDYFTLPILLFASEIKPEKNKSQLRPV